MRKIVPLIIIMFFTALSGFAVPALSSYPSARATIFLDFDGHFVHSSIWNGGNPLACAPSGFNDAQIIEIFHRVSEDYRPFNINITTDSAVFLAAPLAQRIRVIVTTTSNWYPNVGGVAYTRSFTWGDDTPAFSFVDKLNYSPKNVAESCTHESGHALGLSHQAKYNGSCTLVSTYNDGAGSGETGWAPVMGNSYGKNFSGWNNGPTPNGCTADQDNLSIITSINGFNYRTDDHGDEKSNATPVTITNTELFSEGVITTNQDKDIFKLNVNTSSKFNLNARPFSIGANNAGANLDVKVTLLNSNGDIINQFDPLETLHVSVDTSLMPGTYYVVVEGAGNLYVSNYGSLGSYTLQGNLRPETVMAVHKVALEGRVINDRHDLSWSIESDAPVKSVSVEYSTNGSQFNTLNVLPGSERALAYSPLQQEKVYYRLKVTAAEGQVMYSNVISLKGTAAKGELISVSTMVNQQITVKAATGYRYQLSDMSGRIIRRGKGDAGINHIQIQDSPNGIYIMQVVINSHKITNRIVKL